MKAVRLLLAALVLAPSPALAELDLARAGVAHLDNGLTVIVLEDHTLPVVSVQALYKTGSRDETAGKTGLAHFLEHLAFRASENFPDGSATDAIYDVGGEWHGYTWIDQTTYFSTLPADQLDLALAIEADRMGRVTVDAEGVEAEKGAVITEMRGYQNDPTSVLFDAVAAAALQVHPYRNNTIGYEGDVAGLTVADAEAFYASHYAPGNAVLAIVGDVDSAQALARVRAHFGALPAREVAPRIEAVEPPQSGERRITVHGPVERNYLRMAYPAPAASSPDFPAFLLMQELLSGGSGVNFRQNDWGTPSVERSALSGVADDMASWVIPTADPYLFMLSASTADDPLSLEAGLLRRLHDFASSPPDPAALDEAREAVRGALAFDLETPEDAAHQLAFFEGLGALDALLRLDTSLEAVTPDDIHRVASTCLDPSQRTTGWYVLGVALAPLANAAGDPQPAAERLARPAPESAHSAPELHRLANDLPAIVQTSSLSPTATVLLVTRGEGLAAGYGAFAASGLADDLPALLAEVAQARRDAPAPTLAARSNDPETRLGQMIAERAGTPATREPVAVIVSGAVAPGAAIAELEKAFGDLPSGQAPPPAPSQPVAAMQTVAERIDLPLAQAAIGYSLAAPPPSSREGLAMRMLLYVLTHEYGGRLGDAAIKDSGLVYYIGSDYSGDTTGGQVAITTGVDPAKIDAMEALMRSEIMRLASEPPTRSELSAARSHILGRDATAAMDNGEIATHLARTWLATGALPDREALADKLDQVGPEDIARAAAKLATGTILRVDVGPATPGVQP